MTEKPSRCHGSGGHSKDGTPVNSRAPAATQTGPMAACLSDVGRSRGHNEDSFGEDRGLGLWIVADGVGGHAAGEVASELAVSNILRLVADGMPVAEAVSATHDIIRRAPSEGIGKPGMATTVVVAQLNDRRYQVWWVGDSRAYLHGPDGLKRLTVDHSYVQQLLDSGVVTAEEAKVHPERSVLTRCVGWDGHPTVKVDAVAGDLYRGEILVLCTDGLTGEVDDADIAALLRDVKPIAERARRLVDQANVNGGSDNITVALIPAPANAPPKPAAARTRQIPALATQNMPAVGKRRRAVWWTSAAAGVLLTLASGWYWRDRVVELGPALVSYVRGVIDAIRSESVTPSSSSSLAVPPAEMHSRKTGRDRAEDSAQDDSQGVRDASPIVLEGRGAASTPAEDPGVASAYTSLTGDQEETHAAIGDQGP